MLLLTALQEDEKASFSRLFLALKLGRSYIMIHVSDIDLLPYKKTIYDTSHFFTFYKNIMVNILQEQNGKLERSSGDRKTYSFQP